MRAPAKMPMSLRSKSLTLALVAGLFATSVAFAQPIPQNAGAAPKTANELMRERRKALEEAAAERQKRREEWHRQTQETIAARDRKRAECRRQAKEQDLHWLKRVRFMRKCMAA